MYCRQESCADSGFCGPEFWALQVDGGLPRQAVLHLHVERDRSSNFTVTSLTSASVRACPAGAIVLSAVEGDEKTCQSDLSHSNLSLKSIAGDFKFLRRCPLLCLQWKSMKNNENQI